MFVVGIVLPTQMAMAFATRMIHVDVPDSDGDGICDDVDDCDGIYDLCGVCNGPGPIYDCGVRTSQRVIVPATSSTMRAIVQILQRTPMGFLA